MPINAYITRVIFEIDPPKLARPCRIPFIYRQPNGGPLRWQDDTTRELPRAVRAYLNHGIDDGPAPELEQLQLVVDYLIHFIHAPCWRADSTGGLARLQREVAAGEVLTSEEIHAWIDRCREFGIDPL